MSLTDNTVMPVIPAGMMGNSGNNAWGDNGAWWIIILFLFAFCGWGNNGFGGGNGGGQGGYDTRADVQRGFDNQGVMNKLNGLENGISASVYDLNNTLNGNFRSLDNAVCQLGYQTQAGFNNANVANLQGVNQLNTTMLQGQNALSAQLANCCCENREAIQGVNYNLATQAANIQNTNNQNTQRILDYLCQEKISTLQAENQTLKLAASQSAQNNVLLGAMHANTKEVIDRAAPLPVPAYQVPAPYNVPVPFGGVPQGGIAV